MKISLKLIIGFLFTGLISILVVALLSMNISSTALHDEISNKVLTLAEAKEGQVFSYIDSIEWRTMDFASDGLIRDSLKEITATGSPQAAKALEAHLINSKQSLDKRISAIFILDKNGKSVASTHGEEKGKDESTEQYFIEGKKGVHTYNTRNFEGFEDVFVVSTPLTNQDTGEFLGVLSNVFDTAKLHDILSGKFRIEKGALTSGGGLTETLEAYLVDREKSMFIHPFISTAEMHVHGKEHFKGMSVDTFPVQKCIEENKEVVDIYTNCRGEDVIGASMCVPSLDLVLLVEVHVEEAFASIIKLRNQTLLLSLIVALLIVILAVFFSRSISKPISKLKEAAKDITMGKLGTKIEVKGRDEISELARSFDDMRCSLKMIIGEYEKMRNEPVRKTRRKEKGKINKQETPSYDPNLSYKEIEVAEEKKIMKKKNATTNPKRKNKSKSAR